MRLFTVYPERTVLSIVGGQRRRLYLHLVGIFLEWNRKFVLGISWKALKNSVRLDFVLSVRLLSDEIYLSRCGPVIYIDCTPINSTYRGHNNNVHYLLPHCVSSLSKTETLLNAFGGESKVFRYLFRKRKTPLSILAYMNIVWGIFLISIFWQYFYTIIVVTLLFGNW